MDTNLVKLCVDVVQGNVTKYSVKEGNEVIRKAFVDIVGTDKVTPKIMRRHKTSIFEIIEEVVEQTIVDSSIKHTAFYSQFVEEKNLKLGDKNSFYIPNDTVLTVAEFSGNHWDLNRQRVDSGMDFSVKTKAHGIKVYEHFSRFLAGRIDFVELINKLQVAIDKHIGEAATASFVTASANLPTKFKYRGSYDEGKIQEVIDLVQAVNGSEPLLIGTRNAISKLHGVKADLSEAMKNEKNEVGYIKNWNGTQCLILPQVLKANTFEFAFDDSKIYVMTSDVKPVKVVNEGEALVQEVSDGTTNMDMSIEYALQFRMGIATAFNRLFGTLELI